MRLLIVAILALCLAACATTPKVTVYNHPTKTEVEFQKDRYDCNKDAQQRMADSGLNYDKDDDPLVSAFLALYTRNFAVDFFYSCMTAKHEWVAEGTKKQRGKAKYGGTTKEGP